MQGCPAIGVTSIDVGLSWKKILDNRQVTVEGSLVKGRLSLLVFEVGHSVTGFNTPDDDVEIAATGGSMEGGEARARRSVVGETEWFYISALDRAPKKALEEWQVARRSCSID